MGGRHAATTHTAHRDLFHASGITLHGKEGVLLAVAHPSNESIQERGKIVSISPFSVSPPCLARLLCGFIPPCPPCIPKIDNPREEIERKKRHKGKQTPFASQAFARRAQAMLSAFSAALSGAYLPSVHLAPRATAGRGALSGLRMAEPDFDLVIVGCGVGGHGAALHAVVARAQGGRVRGRGRGRHVRQPRLRPVQGPPRRLWPRARHAER